jgi:hypothetical protein
MLRGRSHGLLSSLSVPIFNRQNGHTLLATITTAGHARWPSDYPIHDLRPKGLRVGCVVRWKLFTLDTGRCSGASAILANATGMAVAPPSTAFWIAGATTDPARPEAVARRPAAGVIARA